MAASGGRKVAVVTGGTAGVGRPTVREFARHGYDVAVLARGQAGLDGAVEDVRGAGGHATGIVTEGRRSRSRGVRGRAGRA
jgi:NAD(P)-dependent dehydrogenase (short-subunit alcohol dehydrogenase family)